MTQRYNSFQESNNDNKLLFSGTLNGNAMNTFEQNRGGSGNTREIKSDQTEIKVKNIKCGPFS